jgi:hypothetical protein
VYLDQRGPRRHEVADGAGEHDRAVVPLRQGEHGPEVGGLHGAGPIGPHDLDWPSEIGDGGRPGIVPAELGGPAGKHLLP